MPIPDPWATSTTDAPKDAESAPNGAREREPERDRARTREAPDPAADEEPAGEVVPFPGNAPSQDTDSDAPESSRGFTTAVAVWTAEARETATAAFDGSVWRARPPSLRDIHARSQRAEWAGGIPALRTAGQWFGYLSLALTALGYGLLWIGRRPARLALALLITALTVLFAL